MAGSESLWIALWGLRYIPLWQAVVTIIGGCGGTVHASHHSTCSLETRRRRRWSHQGQQITMAATYVNVYAHTSYPAAKAQKHSLPSFLQSEYLSLSTYTKWGGRLQARFLSQIACCAGLGMVFFKKKITEKRGRGSG